ncbi:MAG: hypothetical protein KIT62_06555 [Cyclobacteriaceae bacterium]|nr:hypothetical protein [Cyclobacteriaceae bacterium]
MHVFVAVLNWGLGHATRSIPVINQLLQRQVEVTIGSDGAALHLLKQEFSTLRFVELPAYEVTYPAHGSLMLNMIIQLPRLRKTIRQEQQQMKSLVGQLGITHIISDNRYGCYSESLPSVMITHQLRLLFSGIWNIAATVINASLRHALQKFNQVWIPDFGPTGITEPFTRKVKTAHRYIGMLSRFSKNTAYEVNDQLIIGLISGPENQRTVFEQNLLAQLMRLNQPAVIVRGLTQTEEVRVQNGVELINHLSASALQDVINHAAVVIARSGYSTVMDLYVLGKRNVILIPTPGQTEQEYLGQYLREKKIAVVQHQEQMDIEQALKQLPEYSGFESVQDEYLLEKALNEFLIA